MKHSGIILIFFLSLSSCGDKLPIQKISEETFCNPLNLSYRFCLEEPSRREAADPTVVVFKNKYYLFASKSGGYWHSDDLSSWTFMECSDIPVEDYAPTAIAIGDTLYFLASLHERNTIYKTADPLSGKWSVAAMLEIPVWDPAFLMDDDKRLYLYWGCSDKNPLYGVELDYKNNFSFTGKPKELMYPDPSRYGWEVPGDYNTKEMQSPWIEGAWVNKYNGKYYLQYSGPGTEFKSYADAVYVSGNPLGPYTLASHNPFVCKPEGFATGAGHGSTFTDRYGNYWHIGTATISVKHMFERRLVLYPVFFDEQDNMYSITRFGDYPLIFPRKKISSSDEVFPEWMLLSYHKNISVSSSVDTLPASNMADEDIRTYWAARSGEKDEFAVIDLGKAYDVYAVQINFAEHNTNIFGRQKDLFHRYILEYSNDNNSWKEMSDKSGNSSDNSHDYIQLPEKVNCRYVRIKNIQVPGGNFALSGFRIFGKGDGPAPQKLSSLEAKRNVNNRKSAELKWERSENATGYNISYGTAKDKLYNNYIVYNNNTIQINNLNADQKYYFSIEAFNENGISGKDVMRELE
jgi:xylan 1,4-beta-xylosidase